MDPEKAAVVEAAPATSPATSQASPSQQKTEPVGSSSQPENPSPAPATSPQPVSPISGPMAILIEAFPNIEPAVVKAVLTASRGELEPAFNALLGMSDPNAVIEETPPPPPPRNPELPPRRSSRAPPQDDYNPASIYYDQGQEPIRRSGSYSTTTPRDQLEADELYARQLAADLGAIPRPHPNERLGGSRSQHRQPNLQGRRRQEYEEDEKEHSFLDDEFPVIKENLRKGFLETQAKVNKWVLDFKKKIDGEDSPPPPPQQRSETFGAIGAHNNYGRDLSHNQRAQNSQYQQAPTRPRYSTDNFDADPTLLTDDFRHLELSPPSNDAPAPARPARPAANPNLLSSDRTKSPKPGRKVSFQDERDEDEDDLYAPPSSKPPVARQASPGTTTGSKWEPLRSVEPTPMDRDPFSLGDSDDEKDHEHDAKELKDVKPGLAGAQESGVKGDDGKAGSK